MGKGNWQRNNGNRDNEMSNEYVDNRRMDDRPRIEWKITQEITEGNTRATIKVRPGNRGKQYSTSIDQIFKPERPSRYYWPDDLKSVASLAIRAYDWIRSDQEVKVEKIQVPEVHPDPEQKIKE